MKPLKVIDSQRNNPLSLQAGGSEIRVLYKDGKNLVYDKVKKPQAYINSVIRDNNVSEIWVDGKKAWPIIEFNY